MNGSDELPPDHFWDSGQAEKEYHAIGRGIAEVEKRLRQAHICLSNALQGIYNHFSHVPGVDGVLKVRGYYDGEGLYPGDHARYGRSTDKWAYRYLNYALNPYWLPDPYWYPTPDEVGRYDYREHPAPWQGSLVVTKVESEPVKAAVGYGREKYRTGAYVGLWIKYSYEKWVGWYAPSGGTVAMSRLEDVLRLAKQQSPFFTSDYNKLLDEVIQDAHTLVAPLSREVVLKFTPDLGPSNIDEIHLSSGYYKVDVPSLSWHTLTRYNAPKVGGRYDLTSYEGIADWPRCGRWEPYRFPEETLRSVCEGIERIDSRLRERIEALASRDVSSCEDELLLLLRRKGAVRTRHYKPLAYKLFWQAASKSAAQSSIEAPANPGRLQLSQAAQSLPGRETRKEETK